MLLFFVFNSIEELLKRRVNYGRVTAKVVI